MTAAKTALFILGGLLLIPGLFQFYSASQLSAFEDSIMGEMAKVLAAQKIKLGVLLTISGCVLITFGLFIKTSKSKY